MLTKFQELTEEREEGFTLIELLVVILIIGILSAIAIPAFLNQRKGAVDSTLQADLASTAKGVETWVTKQGSTAKPLDLAQVQNLNGQTEVLPATGLSGVLSDIKVSDGAVIKATGTSAGYCLHGFNEGGDEANPEKLGYVYASLSGGLKKTAGTCEDGVFTPLAEGGESAPTTPAGVVDNRIASHRTADYELIKEIPYTVTRTENGDGSYAFAFKFSDPIVSGSFETGLCGDESCYDYGMTVTNGEGTVSGESGYHTYGGVMNPLMLSDGTMIIIG